MTDQMISDVGALVGLERVLAALNQGKLARARLLAMLRPEAYEKISALGVQTLAGLTSAQREAVLCPLAQDELARLGTR